MAETRRQSDTGDAAASGGIASALASAAEQPLLKPRESEVYRLLLVAPGLSAAEVAARTGHSLGSVRASLGRLSAGCLVRPSGKRPLRYVANPPATALGGYLHHLEDALDKHRRQIAGLDELYSIGQSKHAHRVMEVVTGRQGIARRFMHLESGVRSEVMVFDRPPYVLQPGDPRQKAAELTLLDRGVRVRCVYDRQGLDSPHALELMAGLSQAGEQARLASGLPVKLAIFDRAAAVLPIGPGSGDDQIMIIRPSALLSVLIEYFERVWRDAAPLLVPAVAATRPPAAARVAATGASRGRSRDDRILALLAAGAADAAIARELGMSERTVGRRVRALMDELGAFSRFQAGVRAALTGRLVLADSAVAPRSGSAPGLDNGQVRPQHQSAHGAPSAGTGPAS